MRILFSLALAFAPVFAYGQEYHGLDFLAEDFKITAADGSDEHEFGHSVDIDDGLIVVGAPYDNDNGTNSGSAYLFDANTGLQLFKLLPEDGVAGAEFGFSVAIKNGLVAVGAKGDSENGTNAGAAYLFDASTGGQLLKILPTDGAPDDEFGNSIDIDDGILVVGAWRADEFGDESGAAYLFDASTGDQLNKLLPGSGNNFQTYGVSVAIDGGITAIGARTFFVAGEGFTYATAYVYEVSNGALVHELQPDILNLNGDLGGFFADSMDISDGLIAIGAPMRSVVFDHSGAVYVFDVMSGEQLHYLVPSDARDRDNFGVSVAIDDSKLMIGAHQDDDNGFNSGSAYFYNAQTGEHLSKVIASDGQELDLFGCSVALDADLAIIGSKNDDDNGSNSGAAYIYSGTTLGTTEFESELVSIYPNPSSGLFIINFESFKFDSIEILIYNSIGQLLQRNDKKLMDGDGLMTVDLSGFESGVYLLNMQLDNRSISKKLVVE